jgi:hypothetical protein
VNPEPALDGPLSETEATKIKSTAAVVRLAVATVPVVWLFVVVLVSLEAEAAMPENSYRVKETSRKVDPVFDAVKVVVVDDNIWAAFSM